MSNATFVTNTVAYLRSQGAVFQVHFDRVDGSNDFVFTDGGEPKTVAAYVAATK